MNEVDARWLVSKFEPVWLKANDDS
jgi:hypothetical protein